MKQIVFVVVTNIAFLFTHAQKATPLWQDFIEAKKKGTTAILPDFSYAGYHFSEKAIPDVSGKKKFAVTDYGSHKGAKSTKDFLMFFVTFVALWERKKLAI
jgi:hypothetical protein